MGVFLAPKVYLVTFQGMTYDEDSKVLASSLERRGIDCEIVSWDDPKVDWSKPDLSIVKSTSNYMLDPEPFLSWAQEAEMKAPLWNSSEIIEWNSDKRYLLELQRKGIPIPPTILVKKDEVKPLQLCLMEVDWNDIVIKPTVAAGSFGLRRFRSDSREADEHLQQLTHRGYDQLLDGTIWPLKPCNVIIQPFIQEIFEGETSLMFFGGKYSHSVIKRAKEGDFRSHPIWGASVDSYEPSKAELRVATDALSLAGRVEYARIDMVNTVGGPLLMELELIEPFFFFDRFSEAAESYADHIADSL
jgi:glutathione synthase/RimK-type ligase-like ATP-grasp enzyme